MKQIIIINTRPKTDEYEQVLLQQFMKGAQSSGLKVKYLSLYEMSAEQAFELGERAGSVIVSKTSKTLTNRVLRRVSRTIVPKHPEDARKERIEVRVEKVVLAIGLKKLPRRQIVADLGLRQASRACFANNYLRPTYEQGYVDFVYPNTPSKPEQLYELTPKGRRLYRKLTGKIQ